MDSAGRGARAVGPNADKRTGFELMAALEQTSEEHSISEKKYKVATCDLSQLSHRLADFSRVTTRDPTVTASLSLTVCGDSPRRTTRLMPLPHVFGRTMIQDFHGGPRPPTAHSPWPPCATCQHADSFTPPFATQRTHYIYFHARRPHHTSKDDGHTGHASAAQATNRESCHLSMRAGIYVR